MNEPATFKFDQCDAAGTVEVKTGGYGLDIEVTSPSGTKFAFLLDLFYLAPDGCCACCTDAQGCVQIVAYNPSDLDGDPVQHLRVFPDGRVVTFDV